MSMQQNMAGNSLIKLTRLLQLCSANLPVGGFSFSQGLEYAVELGWVSCVNSTHDWVSLNMTESVARTDIAIMKRLYQSLDNHDMERFIYWDNYLVACRESNELRLAELAMGKAMIRLLGNLDEIDLSDYELFTGQKEVSYLGAFTLASWLWKIDLKAALGGFCWTYLDNQIAAATKLVPLGQTQAQNLLFKLSHLVEDAIETANQLKDDELGASLPRLAMASSWHETQYSRLFRS